MASGGGEFLNGVALEISEVNDRGGICGRLGRRVFLCQRRGRIGGVRLRGAAPSRGAEQEENGERAGDDPAGRIGVTVELLGHGRGFHSGCHFT